ncbi:MAG: hypothetical protein MUF40_01760 [Gemmatimonadaceae bacterium]|nr:hypothetical protein [Gemmatimonadaceae bacterium]
MPRVEKLAGLTFKRPPAVAAPTPAQVQTFLRRTLDEPRLKADLEAKARVYKRLGVIPDTLDVRAMLLAVLGEQVVGYYDPRVDTLYVVQGRRGVERETVIIHELTHALQDQYVALDSIEQLAGEDDRALAAQAVFEGHATLTMVGEAARTIVWEQARDAIRDARPPFIAEGLLFPYLGGAEFVRTVLARGTTPAQLLADLPRGTSQVLHPERYGATANVPEALTLPMRPGTTVAYANTFGEFETRLALTNMLGDAAQGIRAARGHDGDRYAWVTTPAGDGLVWAVVWDSAIEAAGFLDVAASAFARRYGEVEVRGGVRIERLPGVRGSGEVRELVTSGRRVTFRAIEVDGRPVTVIEDLPAAATGPVTDLAALRVTAR